MADTTNLEQFLTDVAQAIRDKKGTEEEIPAKDFDTEILSIVSGGDLDTSDATATADDILSPKTAYVKGQKVVGNIGVEYITGDDIQEINLSADLDNTNTNVLSKLLAVTEDGTGMLAPVVTEGVQSLGIFKINNDKVSLIKSYSFESLGMTSTNRVRFSLGRRIEGLKYPLYYGNTNSATLYCQIIDFSSDEPVLESNRITTTLSRNLMALQCHPTLNNLVYVCWYINDYVWYMGVYEVDYVNMSMTKKYGNYQFNVAAAGSDKGRPFLSDNGSVLTFAGEYVSNERPYDGYVYRLNESGQQLGYVQTSNKARYNGVSPDGKYCIFDGTLYAITENGTTSYTLVTIGDTGLTTTFEFGYRFIGDAKNVVSVDSENMLTISELNLETAVSTAILWQNKIYGVASNQTNTNSLYVINSSRTAILKFTVETEQIPLKMTRDNRVYITTSDATATANDILEGQIAYAKGEEIEGNMPNNGELVFDPSDEEQIIPAGYTSGGRINSTNITDLKEYDTCLAISTEILSGTEMPYSKLHYIETTGTQYVVTDIPLMNYDSWKIELDYLPTAVNYNYNGIWGVADNSTAWEAWIARSADSYARYNSVKPSAITMAITRVKYTDEFTGTQMNTYINDELVRSYEVESNKTQSALKLLAAASCTSKARLYDAKLYGNNKLLAHYIPVLDLAGIPCLYDTVSSKLLYSASGTFIAGAIIS